MLYLAAAIACSTIIGQLIKESEVRGADRVVVLTVNYITAAVLGWVVVLFRGDMAFSSSTLLLGLGGGILWPAGFVLMMTATRWYGISLTASLARLSLAVPVAIALLFLDESLSLPLISGLILVIVAFFLINPVKREALVELDLAALLIYPALILILGTADFWVNLFHLTSPEGENLAFITLIFSFSAVLMLLFSLVTGKNFDRPSVMRGAALGIPNILSTVFLLDSLRTPVFSQASSVVYSVYSVGTLVLTVLIGVLFWKERLSVLSRAGIGAALLAIVLLQMA